MAYATQAEYLNRFGEAETIRLTDEEKTGSVDTAALDEALEDATDLANGYLAKRYATPLVDAPRLVRHIVVVLAREHLHKTRPTAQVTLEADRARSQLRDISKGVIDLEVAAGDEAPVDTGSRLSTTSGDAASPVFTDNSLAGFTSLSNGYGAAWRS